MGRSQRAAGLNRDIEYVGQIKARLDASSQGLAFNEFGGNETNVFAAADLVDGENVWMIQAETALAS